MRQTDVNRAENVLLVKREERGEERGGGKGETEKKQKLAGPPWSDKPWRIMVNPTRGTARTICIAKDSPSYIFIYVYVAYCINSFLLFPKF